MFLLFFICLNAFNPRQKADTINTVDGKEVETKKGKLRVKYITDYLENDPDFICKEVNDIVKAYELDEEENIFLINYTCTDKDILTDAKINALRTTLENVRKYISPILEIVSFNDDIQIDHSFVEGYSYNASVSNSDLAIIITSHVTKVTGVLGFSEMLLKTQYNNRVVGAATVIVPSVIPNNPQNVNDIDRSFFILLLHELVHVLGFSSRLFPDWKHSKAIETRHNPLFANAGILFQDHDLVVTPEVAAEIGRRFQVTEFVGDGQLGAELFQFDEHLRKRLFQEDLMIYDITPATKMTNLTLCSLYDTGWYTSVDFSKAESNYYGIISDEFKASLPQRTVDQYPYHYKCVDPKTKSKCFANPKYRGSCKAISYSCSDDKLGICSNYNSLIEPNNAKEFLISDDQMIDYLPLVYPGDSCNFQGETGEKVDPNTGIYYGHDSYCADSNFSSNSLQGNCYQMYCDEQNAVYIKVGTHLVKCVNSAESIRITNSVLICPDPNIVCRMAPKHVNEPDNDPDGLEEGNKLNSAEVGGISAAAAVVGVGGIGVAVFFSYRYYKAKKNDEASHNEEEEDKAQHSVASI